MDFEELKKKVSDSGYMSLSGDERKAYSSFKKSNEKSEAPKKAPAKKTEEPKMTVTKSELQEMINEGIQNYRNYQADIPEKQGVWKEVEPTKGNNKTAKLRLYQEDAQSPYGVITKADYLKTIWNEETHKHDKILYSIEVLYDDGKKDSFEMDVLDYVKLNQTETVELVDNERKQMRSVSGKVGVPLKDKDGFPIVKMNAGGYGSAKGIVGEVELEVIRYNETFTAKRPNGQTFKIHSKYLNA